MRREGVRSLAMIEAINGARTKKASIIRWAKIDPGFGSILDLG
jgi:hypothetical protein